MFVESRLTLSTLKHVEQRLLREYLDLPSLSLTLAQAARLVWVDAPTCEVVLNDLVSDRGRNFQSETLWPVSESPRATHGCQQVVQMSAVLTRSTGR